VRYPRGTHNGDVAVPPAWHQWLRHTRPDPPSLGEQQAEVARQERIRLLAAQADARWEAKPKVMEGGGPSSPEGKAMFGLREPPLQTDRRAGPGSSSKAAEGRAPLGEMNATGRTGVTKKSIADDDAAAVPLGDDEAVIQREETWKRMQQEAEEKEKKGGDGKPDPWKQAKGGPSETWQPQAWQPTPKAKK
jgi:NADH dehydrogenase [ubiquinone] 1 alpha subcomplex assembly factor 2